MKLRYSLVVLIACVIFTLGFFMGWLDCDRLSMKPELVNAAIANLSAQLAECKAGR